MIWDYVSIVLMSALSQEKLGASFLLLCSGFMYNFVGENSAWLSNGSSYAIVTDEPENDLTSLWVPFL